MNITGIVHLGNAHVKNKESIERMVRKFGIPFSNDEKDVDNPLYNLILHTDDLIIPKHFNKLYISGPHIWSYSDSRFHDLKNAELYRGLYFNCLSPNVQRFNESICEEVVFKNCYLPFPIDTDVWKPDPQKSNVAIIYIKDRRGQDVDVVKSLFKEKFIGYTFVEFDYTKTYKENDLLASAKVAKACLLIDASESQGFAVQQILSANVPVLCYDNLISTSISPPEPPALKFGIFSSRSTWDESCGEYFYSPQIINRALDKFYKGVNSGRYHPRQFILRELSDEACWRKWNTFFEQAKFQKNLCIIHSIIDPPKTPLSYIHTRSVYTREERFEQLKRSITTVRNKIPHCYIVLVECSPLNAVEVQYLSANTDLLINLFSDEDAKNVIHGVYKGNGERTMLLEAFSVIDMTKFDNFFKLSGRYYLNDEFDYLKFNNFFNVVHLEPNDSMNTTFYKVHSSSFKFYLEKLNETGTQLKTGVSMEQIFRSCFDKYVDTTVGVEGNVAVCGTFIKR